MNKSIEYLQNKIDKNKKYALIVFIMVIIILMISLFCLYQIDRAHQQHVLNKKMGNLLEIEYEKINNLRVFRDLNEKYYDFIEIPQPEYSGTKINIGKTIYNKFMDIVLCEGDLYRVEFYNGNSLLYALDIGTAGNVRFWQIELKENVYISGFNTLIIKPITGNQFGVAYVGFYDNKQDSIANNEVKDSHKNILYYGIGEMRPYGVTAVQAAYIEQNEDNIILEILNIHALEVKLISLQNKEGDMLGYFENISLNPYEFDKPLDDQYEIYEIKKINTSADIDPSELYIGYMIEGSENESTAQVYLFDRYNDELFGSTDVCTYDNIDEFDFVEKNGGRVTFTQKNVTIDMPLFIPEDYSVILAKGQSIDLTNGAYIVSRSPVFADGTQDEMIKITSSDMTGKGIFVQKAGERSSVNYVEFSYLDTPSSGAWSLTGAVTFYESDVDFTGCIFNDNLCEDGLNVVRSDFYITGSTFRNTFADAFDSDFSSGTIEKSRFENTGNDATDVSTSNVLLEDIIFTDIGDKAVSGGEKSVLHLSNISVDRAEIGIASKDTTHITGEGIVISDTHFGCVLYRKKPEFEGGYISVDSLELKGDMGIDYLIEKGSELWVNGKKILPRSAAKEDLLIEKMKLGEKIE